MRNYALGTFGAPLRADDAGFLFQNLIFQILREKIQLSGSRLHFWRTKDKAEVDFVIETGADPLPVEVKYGAVNSSSVRRSLRSFIDHYKPKEAFVITKSYRDNIIINKTAVEFLPFFELYRKKW